MSRVRYLVLLAFIIAVVFGLSTSMDRSACALGNRDLDMGTNSCVDGTGSCSKLN
jgi:hypothetical protein